jgi:hypothetical protein
VNDETASKDSKDDPHVVGESVESLDVLGLSREMMDVLVESVGEHVSIDASSKEESDRDDSMDELISVFIEVANEREADHGYEAHSEHGVILALGGVGVELGIVSSEVALKDGEGEESTEDTPDSVAERLSND